MSRMICPEPSPPEIVLARGALDRPARMTVVAVHGRTADVRAEGAEVVIRFPVDHLFQLDLVLFRELQDAARKGDRVTLGRLWGRAKNALD